MRAALGVVAGVAVLLTWAVPAATVPPAAPVDGLASIALAAVAARNEYRVTGTARTDPAFAEWFVAEEEPGLHALRDTLTAEGTAYTWHEETVTVTSTTVAGGYAVLVAQVDEALGMTGLRGITGVPERTAGSDEVRFVFVHDGMWRLREVRGSGRG